MARTMAILNTRPLHSTCLLKKYNSIRQKGERISAELVIFNQINHLNMKTLLFLLVAAALLIGCSVKEIDKTYLAEPVKPGQKFNDYPDRNDSTITFKAHRDSTATTALGANPKIWYQVKFGDTVVFVQTNPSNTASANKKFIRGKFLNTQHTALLAQIADSTGLAARFYIIALKDHLLKVTELYRPTSVPSDKALFGMVEVGRSGFVIDNDFFVSYVNPKVYFLKRQKEEERIRGQFFLKSTDAQTLAFLMPNSELYQVNYGTGETYTVPFGMNASQAGIYAFAEQNFTWKKNEKGAEFLLPDSLSK